jgi:adenylylsulfate kinase
MLDSSAYEWGQKDMQRKILIMGLPGAGKTSLAGMASRRLNAVHFNADEVRAHINKDLGFSEQDRIEHARRMGWLCDRVVRTGGFAIADFVCPTPATRAAFAEGGPAFVVWCDRISAGRYDDTNRMFVRPECVDLRVTAEGSVDYWTEKLADRVRPVFDPKKPTALFVGRYQPFHDGHKALIISGLTRIGQACVAVRDTGGLDQRNPYRFESISARIDHALREFEGRYTVVPLPNITHVFYGRDVGYVVEQISLDQSIEALSATDLRRRLLPAADIGLASAPPG